jgi:hypothetical protein
MALASMKNAARVFRMRLPLEAAEGAQLRMRGPTTLEQLPRGIDSSSSGSSSVGSATARSCSSGVDDPAPEVPASSIVGLNNTLMRWPQNAHPRKVFRLYGTLGASGCATGVRPLGWECQECGYVVRALEG